MAPKKINNFRDVVVPIFELDDRGAIIPNTLFHRTWDFLHSRCVEYPFAASQVGESQCLLDVGTVKSDAIWISWLESLSTHSIEVHGTDYDAPIKPFKNIKFHQADVRELPIEDQTFDRVIAVSVIEHIGLQSPQVLASSLPSVDQDGDLEAVRELARVLKPGGELIMTLPFGIRDELILNRQARNYTTHSIRKFEQFLQPVKLEYYEYQRRQKIQNEDQPLGLITWNRLPLTSSKAEHHNHTDGVVCGVWKKTEDELGGVNLTTDLSSKLRLKEINLIVSVDFNQSTETIFGKLKELIKIMAVHPDKNRICLLLEANDCSEENANLIVSDAAMTLFMEENLDIEAGPEIVIVTEELQHSERMAILKCIKARIILNHEDGDRAFSEGSKIPAYYLNQIGKMRF